MVDNISGNQHSALKITYLKNSAFLLAYGTSRLIIDPGSKKLGKMGVDIIFATHRHTDHIAGIKVLMKHNPEAKLICNQQVADGYKKNDEINKRMQVCEPGKDLEHIPWKFTFLEGKHGLFKGEQNTMVIITTENGQSFGHAGDTVTIKPFANRQLDYLAVPIGGLFTASGKKILKELKDFEKPIPTIIPMHWIVRSPKKFCKQVKKELPEVHCIVPKGGKELNYLEKTKQAL